LSRKKKVFVSIFFSAEGMQKILGRLIDNFVYLRMDCWKTEDGDWKDGFPTSAVLV